MASIGWGATIVGQRHDQSREIRDAVGDLRERYRRWSPAPIAVSAVAVVGILLIVGAAIAAQSGIDVANPFDCRRCGLPTLTQNLILVGGCLIGAAVVAAIIYAPAAFRRAIVRRDRPESLILLVGRLSATATTLKRIAPKVNGTTPLIPAVLVMTIDVGGLTVWGLLADPLLELTWDEVDVTTGEASVGVRRVPTLRLTMRQEARDAILELLPARPRSDGFLYSKLPLVRELVEEIDALKRAEASRTD